ncbi:hypothetical protein [Bosea sp. 117]|uniref:hypothetical protein n=1 Tax=Bosea sp. 117 TaxID=1125973 RepID=UPI000493E747|nr:hypothetical protein [Bosea sp. 117]
MVLAVVAFGVCAIEYSTGSIFIAVLASVVGMALTKLDYPAVPLILGPVLGPMLERNIRRTLIQSQGDVLVFVERPIALGRPDHRRPAHSGDIEGSRRAADSGRRGGSLNIHPRHRHDIGSWIIGISSSAAALSASPPPASSRPAIPPPASC